VVTTSTCSSPFPDFPDVVRSDHVRFRAARQTSEYGAPLFTSWIGVSRKTSLYCTTKLLL
jgi:hypothetical protein